ncbi:MAG: chemotaxis protein CheV [Phycisphaerales bacterium]|nr:chemotaxis protein CheV [Phycisphaerales bacterium]
MNEIKGITGDILLDAGTNELEVLVFSLCGGWFGVNVAKVREVIRPVSTVATPHQHPSVVGMFNIRGHVVPVVDLAKHLGLTRPEHQKKTEGRVIITEFNSLRTGFLVDTVEQIHRMSWSRVKPAPDLSVVGSEGGASIGTTTGMIEMGDRLIQMIDFESVADAILVEKRLHIEKVDNPDNVARDSKRVIIAEDSPFMRQLLQDIFVASGYTKVEVYADGEQAWNAIQKPGPTIDAIVSDIEMPRMDGLHLTKRIKGTPALAGTRIVLFSSLITPDNLKKGRQVGADAQVSKPELAEMVRLVDQVVTGRPIGGDLQKAAS